LKYYFKDNFFNITVTRGQIQDGDKSAKQPTILQRRNQLSTGAKSQQAAVNGQSPTLRECHLLTLKAGFYEATGSTAVTQCGWQVKPLHEELVSTDNRHMGD